MILEHLAARARQEPASGIFTWVDDDGRDADSRDAGTLWARVQTLSGYLRGPCGLRPGDRALLVYPPSLAFVDAFVACLYAGIIPVPAYPPDPRKARDVNRLGRIARSARAQVALTDTKFRWALRFGSLTRVFGREQVEWNDLRWHTTDDIRTGAFPARQHDVKPADVAFLQFTSGSTSEPRGAALTFANLDLDQASAARVGGN